MHIKLPYGTEHVPVDVPDNWINGRCYRPHPMQGCADEQAELMGAIGELAGPESLAEIGSGKNTCAIAVDSENPAVFKQLLPALIEAIEDATDIPSSAITVIVSNRLVPPLTQQEFESLVPPSVRKNYKVVLHDPAAADSLEYLNRSPGAGLPISINKEYVSAELKIILSGVRPDMVFGFTGGRAVLVPGLAGEETLRALYTLENINNENAHYGNFRDNPFHLAGMEAAQIAGCDFSVSATLTADGKINKVFTGNYAKSHIQAMTSQRGGMLVKVKEPMDIVVTSGGGAPLDGSLLRVLETIAGVTPVLKPGGTVVICAALSEGLGPSELTELIRRHASLTEAIDSLSSSDRLYAGQWLALRLYKLLEKHEVIVYNKDIDDTFIWSIGFTPAKDLNEAIHEAMTGHGQACKIVALPDGPSGLASLG